MSLETPQQWANKSDGFISKIIFQNANFALRYSGPDPKLVDRVVVSFPDLIHETGFDAIGWGEPFFRKRNQPVIYVLFKTANWYQSEGFLDAMKAARKFLGETVKVSAYGASMGGYGAILAGKSLKADYVLALCPQYSIQQDITPFERRYRNQAREIGVFRYDIDSEMDNEITYVVAFDPTHNIDRRHEAMFKKPEKWKRVLLPGSSHGVLSNILEMSTKANLLELILNQISPSDFRNILRQGRTASPRYIRRMGNLTSRKQSKFTNIFIALAQEKSFGRLVNKWQDALRNDNTKPLKIILHPGLPKTGTSAIQMYFKRNADKYLRDNVLYPLEGANKIVYSHSWMSSAMRNKDFSPILRQLQSTAQTTKKLIISDESLYLEAPLLSPEARAELRKIFAPHSVRIVFCQRPLGKWKKSFYLQALKNRRSADKQSVSRLWGTDMSYSSFFKDPFVEKLTDFNACIKDFANIIGAEQVEIINMKSGENIIPVFCQAADIQYFEETTIKLENLSMNDVGGEIQRQANNLSVKHAGLVKRLLGLPKGFSFQNTPAPRIQKLASMGENLPWKSFAFQTNPPLDYDKAGFITRVAEIEMYASQLAELSDK